MYVYKVELNEYTYTSGIVDLDDEIPWMIDYFSSRKAAENYILKTLDEAIEFELMDSRVKNVKATIGRNYYKAKFFYKRPEKHWAFPQEPKRAQALVYVIKRITVRDE